MYRDHEQEVEGGIDDLVIVRWTGHALEAMDFMGPVSRVDVIVRYRISSTENEGGLAHLPVWHPLGALDGELPVVASEIPRFLVATPQKQIPFI